VIVSPDQLWQLRERIPARRFAPAIHEAGHAIVAMRLGIYVKRLVIIGVGGRCEHGVIENDFNHLAVAVAGGIAERIGGVFSRDLTIWHRARLSMEHRVGLGGDEDKVRWLLGKLGEDAAPDRSPVYRRAVARVTEILQAETITLLTVAIHLAIAGDLGYHETRAAVANGERLTDMFDALTRS
jgi:hypothetical protein